MVADATCLHSHPAVNSCIWETLLAINVFHLLADVAKHESTTVESGHNKFLGIFEFNAGTVF